MGLLECILFPVLTQNTHFVVTHAVFILHVPPWRELGRRSVFSHQKVTEESLGRCSRHKGNSCRCTFTSGQIYDGQHVTNFMCSSRFLTWSYVPSSDQWASTLRPLCPEKLKWFGRDVLKGQRKPCQSKQAAQWPKTNAGYVNDHFAIMLLSCNVSDRWWGHYSAPETRDSFYLIYLWRSIYVGPLFREIIHAIKSIIPLMCWSVHQCFCLEHCFVWTIAGSLEARGNSTTSLSLCKESHYWRCTFLKKRCSSRFAKSLIRKRSGHARLPFCKWVQSEERKLCSSRLHANVKCSSWCSFSQDSIRPCS